VQAALRVVLSPLQHASVESWTQAICDAVLETFEVDSAVSILSQDGTSVVATRGALTRRHLAEYLTQFHGRLEGERQREAHGLRAWVREDVWSTTAVERTAYYNEFCVPAGYRDSAGMSVRSVGGHQHVVYIADARRRRFQIGGREAVLLSLLQPALAAAAVSLRQLPAMCEFGTAVEVPFALFDRHGRRLHANEAFGGLEAKVSGVELHRAADRLAREIQPRFCERQFDGPASLSWRAADGSVSLHASLWEPAGLPATPYCIVLAVVHGLEPPVKSLRDRWSLTPREAQVALLLSAGRSNKEIAQTLGTTSHTARRHTEHVLQKIGVHSRAAVAVHLRRQAGDFAVRPDVAPDTPGN
jgi:DNA-binding CsgD family transcriptional regulator